MKIQLCTNRTNYKALVTIGLGRFHFHLMMYKEHVEGIRISIYTKYFTLSNYSWFSMELWKD
ncbi:hypothetical protein J32TS6_26020 [Virgibacillus pantothenticus]|nr:hypothetical protein J32TS6_26020 [Virgibacillus pantothenticus]